VLVVEDDDAVRDLFMRTLTDNGFDVVLALDGAHALRLTATLRPDAIVLDFGLPEISGRAFVELWRERRDHARDVPIIGVSALPDGERIAAEIGAQEFISKPFDIDDLIGAVRRLTTRSGVGRTGRST
jgi:DNA-binding response OmpR family regulator